MILNAYEAPRRRRKGAEGPSGQGARGRAEIPEAEGRERRRGISYLRPARAKRASVAILLLTAVSTAASLQAGESNGRAFTLTGGRVLLPDGQLADGLAVVVSGGRIQRVTEAGTPGLPSVKRLDRTSVLSPGLIDLGSSVGANRQNVETARAIDAGASARTAVDRSHRDLRIALKAGITAATVCPAPRNVVSGTAVTFATAGTEAETGVLRDDGPLVFALGSTVLRRNRAPTSRGGARNLLRKALSAARTSGGAPPIRSFLGGRTPGWVFCQDEPDVRAAFELFDEAGRLPCFVCSRGTSLDDLARFADAAATRNVLVVIGPYDFTTGEPLLRTGGMLDRAGVDVAFSGGLPVESRHSLRVTAALAVRYGMDAAAARRALTVRAAEAAGVADRIGAITSGRDGDLVVFSDDPLRLDARVLEVYVRGVRQYAWGESP